MIVHLCLFVRNEDDYVKDWIDWYLNLGFDKLFIYDNNEDKSRLQRVLKCFENDQRVEIVPWDGRQVQGYKDCWVKDTEADWLGWFDCDEILELNGSARNIKELLQRYGRCHQLSFKCIEYNDNGKITCSDEELKIPFYLRFPKVSPKQYEHFHKSIFNKHVIKSTNGFGEHCYKSRTLDWRKRPGGFCFPPSYRPQRNEPFIKHFRTKSLEEFARTKLFVESRKGVQGSCLRRNLPSAYYFKCNYKTPEKLKFLEEYKKAHGIVYRLFFVTRDQYNKYSFLKNQFCYIFGNPNVTGNCIHIGKSFQGFQLLKELIDDFDEFIFLK